MTAVEEILHLVFAYRIAHQTSNYAVFDFDKTYIFNDIGEAVLAHMARRNFPGARANFEEYYRLGDIGDMRAQYRFGAITLQGVPASDIDQLVEDTLDAEETEITTTTLFQRTIARGIARQPQVCDLMDGLKEDGVQIWIVSASPEVLVRAAMYHLDVDAHLIGVRNLIKDGIITDHLVEPLSIFEGKVTCIQQLIHERSRPLIGVGNSMNDLPMLEYSELRVAVDPGDALAAKARKEGWFLLEK